MQQSYTYLALGDSYTIGESVLLQKSFPYQTVQLLRKKGLHFSSPEIIARSGWTSDELTEAMKDYQFMQYYTFVSVLIGVNNQYRGKDVILFKEELETLVQKAISLAHDKKDHVVLLSIPDYSATPYAQTMDKEKITKEIEVYNSVVKALSIQYKVLFLDISSNSEIDKDNDGLLADDGLHPSAKQYAKWAKKLAEIFSKQLK